MATWIADAVLDAALDHIADNGDKIYFCSAQPTTQAEAATTYALADSTLTVGDGNGSYVVGDGDTNGRKLTVTPATGITVDSNGTITHVAITDGTNVLYVKELDAGVAVTTANPIDPDPYDIEIGDPANE